MAHTPSEIELTVSLAVVRPGDRLVMATGFINKQQADQIKARLREDLPGVEVTLVSGVSQVLVYRPDGQE